MPAHKTPFLRLFQHAGQGHQAFLFGENSLNGWWYYFPLAFLVKAPSTLLILFPGAVAMTMRRLPPQQIQLTALIAFLFIYTVTVLISPLNIGYRHMRPLLFVVYIWTGAFMQSRSFWKYILCCTLMLYQVTNTLTHSPYLLGWFNSISGGPENGWRYLADSNTDWWQDFQTLSQYQSDNGLETLQLAGYVFYDPAIYDLDYTPLTPMHGNTQAIFPSRFAPAPGHYAISLTSLDGIPLADNEMYDWFRWRESDERIANAIHYYAIREDETITNWIAQCVKPVAPLNQEDVQSGFGAQEQRRYIPFDCTQSWIIPGSEDGHGVYVIHDEHLINTI